MDMFEVGDIVALVDGWCPYGFTPDREYEVFEDVGKNANDQQLIVLIDDYTKQAFLLADAFKLVRRKKVFKVGDIVTPAIPCDDHDITMGKEYIVLTDDSKNDDGDQIITFKNDNLETDWFSHKWFSLVKKKKELVPEPKDTVTWECTGTVVGKYSSGKIRVTDNLTGRDFWVDKSQIKSLTKYVDPVIVGSKVRIKEKYLKPDEMTYIWEVLFIDSESNAMLAWMHDRKVVKTGYLEVVV